MTNNNGNDDYEVGHGKPPKKYQFKRGQSGNPKGRPKTNGMSMRMSMGTFRQFMVQEAWETVSVKENGEIIHMPKVQLMIRQLFNQAGKGDKAATKMVLDYYMPMMNQGDKEHSEWLVAWLSMQQRKLEASQNPGSLEHFDAMYSYFMFKKDMRAIEGPKGWVFEDGEPITDIDWKAFMKAHSELRKAPDQPQPWPLEYSEDDINLNLSLQKIKDAEPEE